MTIIERIDNAATRAQLAAMGTLRDAAQRLQGPRDDTSARGPRDPEEAPPPSNTRSAPSPPLDSQDCLS